jgi:hypothetical protein
VPEPVAVTKSAAMKKFFILLFIGILGVVPTVFAQEIKEAPKKPAPEIPPADILALAKASENPVNDLNTIPIQFNFYSGGGVPGNQTLTQTLIQPVMPLPLNDNFNVILRTVVPVISLPTAGGEKLNGIADIQEQIYLSPLRPGKIIWGFGPILSLPTATITPISTGQFSLGPTCDIVVIPGRFVIGAIINQLWRIGGNSSTRPVNQFFAQPFINYNFKLGWSVVTAPMITANWAAPGGQQWTLPLGGGISKITLIGQQPINLSFQYYHNAISPASSGADQVRMVVSFLFPKKK